MRTARGPRLAPRPAALRGRSARRPAGHEGRVCLATWRALLTRTPLAEDRVRVSGCAHKIADAFNAPDTTTLRNFAVALGTMAIHLVTTAAGAAAFDTAARSAVAHNPAVSLVPSWNRGVDGVRRSGARAGIGVTT